jgi:hypothetical protein
VSKTRFLTEPPARLGMRRVLVPRSTARSPSEVSKPAWSFPAPMSTLISSRLTRKRGSWIEARMLVAEGLIEEKHPYALGRVQRSAASGQQRIST